MCVCVYVCMRVCVYARVSVCVVVGGFYALVGDRVPARGGASPVACLGGVGGVWRGWGTGAGAGCLYACLWGRGVGGGGGGSQ